MRAIVDMARRGGGLVTTAQVTEAGIPRSRLSEMVRSGVLERVQRGVYCLADEWEDEFLAAKLRFPRGIFSDDTALYLHDFTDRTPERLTMTFARSYNATKAREAGIEVRTCADDVRDLGVTVVRTPYGNDVRAYDLERTLCDLVRGRWVVDVQIVSPAVRRYVRAGRGSPQRLLEYACALGVEGKIRGYLEALL